jgi:predicted negative regulator of RcsB-dependent stress response
MDEEITIIDSSTRNEKIFNFFINNKKNIIIGISILLIVIVTYFSSKEIKERNKIKLANKYNLITINFKEKTQQITKTGLIDIINQNDSTYSPLALYFLVDNSLIDNNTEMNKLFDELINETNLKNEIKNLIIYKKALFNANFVKENDLLLILNPIINSESIWKSHALYLLAEYFYSKGEKKKAKEFFDQILTIPNNNSDVKLETQQRLIRDFGE